MRIAALALAAFVAPLAVAIAQQPPAQTLPAGHPPLGGAAAAPAITHHGTVLETIDVAPYVYIHVKAESGDEWLAAPAMPLAKGAAINWPDGLAMTNFHSKTLDRTFDKVTFVNTVTSGK
jgi:hypothetical protein